MPSKDHYKILGVDRQAKPDDIKAAYKKQALRWHPDRNPGNVGEAEIRFKEIAAAFEILSDPVKRHDYNQELREATLRRDDFSSFTNSNRSAGYRPRSAPRARESFTGYSQRSDERSAPQFASFHFENASNQRAYGERTAPRPHNPWSGIFSEQNTKTNINPQTSGTSSSRGNNNGNSSHHSSSSSSAKNSDSSPNKPKPELAKPATDKTNLHAMSQSESNGTSYFFSSRPPEPAKTDQTDATTKTKTSEQAEQTEPARSPKQKAPADSSFATSKSQPIIIDDPDEAMTENNDDTVRFRRPILTARRSASGNSPSPSPTPSNASKAQKPTTSFAAPGDSPSPSNSTSADADKSTSNSQGGTSTKTFNPPSSNAPDSTNKSFPTEKDNEARSSLPASFASSFPSSNDPKNSPFFSFPSSNSTQTANGEDEIRGFKFSSKPQTEESPSSPMNTSSIRPDSPIMHDFNFVPNDANSKPATTIPAFLFGSPSSQFKPNTQANASENSRPAPTFLSTPVFTAPTASFSEPPLSMPTTTPFSFNLSSSPSSSSSSSTPSTRDPKSSPLPLSFSFFSPGSEPPSFATGLPPKQPTPAVFASSTAPDPSKNPGFTFGSTSTASTKPAFSTAAAAPPASTKPAFSFTATAPPAPSSQPGFTFSATPRPPAAAPNLFSLPTVTKPLYGVTTPLSQATSTSLPTFSFGASPSPVLPSFFSTAPPQTTARDSFSTMPKPATFSPVGLSNQQTSTPVDVDLTSVRMPQTRLLVCTLSELYTGAYKNVILKRLRKRLNSPGFEEEAIVRNVYVSPGREHGSQITVEDGDEIEPSMFQSLILVIEQTPDPVFERKGNDLYSSIDVRLADALTGAALIKTLDGRAIPLAAPSEVIQPGSLITLASEGMPNAAGQKGNLYVKVNVLFPKYLNINAKQKETLCDILNLSSLR